VSERKRGRAKSHDALCADWGAMAYWIMSRTEQTGLAPPPARLGGARPHAVRPRTARAIQINKHTRADEPSNQVADPSAVESDPLRRSVKRWWSIMSPDGARKP
jgi:hypothetical protein